MSSTPGSIHFPQRPRAWLGAAGRAPWAAFSRVAATCVSVIAVFLFAGVIGLGLYNVAQADRVYQGVSVAGVNLGGMTESEARTAIEQTYATYLSQPISLSYNGDSYA